MCGNDGLLGKDLYSILLFEPLQNLYLGVWGLSKLFLVQSLSFDEIYSYSGGSAGKWKRLSLVRLPLLKACSARLPDIEKKSSVPDLEVNFAKKEQTAQIDGLLTRAALRGAMEGRD